MLAGRPAGRLPGYGDKDEDEDGSGAADPSDGDALGVTEGDSMADGVTELLGCGVRDGLLDGCGLEWAAVGDGLEAGAVGLGVDVGV
jgi:hypothetical protein